MPTKEYPSADAAWQSLTDLELEDDSRDYPVAVITIRGVGKIKIEMLSEWDYFSTFLPMRQKFITYYANKLLADENVKNKDVILEKVQAFQNEISLLKETGKSETLTYLFSDVEARYTFFKDMKKMGMIPRLCSWKRWQKHARVLDTMTIFAFLWLFNVDGLKKNAKLLVDRISRVMITASPTGLKVFTDLDSFKKAHALAHARLFANSEN